MRRGFRGINGAIVRMHQIGIYVVSSTNTLVFLLLGFYTEGSDFTMNNHLPKRASWDHGPTLFPVLL